MTLMRNRLAWSSEAAIITILGCTVTVAILLIGELVEERRNAASAMQLQLAVTEVVHADALAIAGGEPDLVAVAASVGALADAHLDASNGLSAEEAAALDALAIEVVEHGKLMLEDSGAQPLAPHDHDKLEQLLAASTRGAAARAAAAEQWALAAVLGFVLALIAAGWITARSRLRSERVQAAVEIQAREGDRLQTLLDSSPDCVFVIDPTEGITYRSRSCASLISATETSLADVLVRARKRDQASLRSHITRVDSNNQHNVFELRKADGTSGWFDIRVSDLTDDALVDGYLLFAREISTEVRLRHQLEHQASTDDLTGLPNRRVLGPRLEMAQAQIMATGGSIGLLILDIDGFKAINDTLGHPTGDELLVKVAARLGKEIRAEETLVRMGGDEFALVLPSLSGPGGAQQVADRILGALQDPFAISDRLEHIRTSIGMAVTADPNQVKALIGQADVALYEAKRLGGARAVLHKADLEEEAGRHAHIVRGLRDAHYATEFSLVFQPIVDVDGEQTVAFETLLRWTSPDLGVVAPAEFVPVAEVCGEICDIGRWVFQELCRHVASWDDVGIPPEIRASFNVSPRQLDEPGFVPWLLETIRNWNIPASRFIVEVTESTALDQSRAQRRLHQLRDAGLLISIDDFGAGYSNLSQLISVPVDIIKVDRSLLVTLSTMRDTAGGDPTGPCSIMQAIVSIASILDAMVVCEGVETEEQRCSLRASGISHIQGYLIGRPGPSTHAVSQLGANASGRSAS